MKGRGPAWVVPLLLCIAQCVGARTADGFTVRYFAYGSNLARSVIEGRRRLRPLSTAPAVAHDERLAFDIPGFGILEPAFASLAQAPGDECHGAVYELSVYDWARLCASEGVPTGYRVREVGVDLYSGERVQAWTLSAGLLRASPDRLPSPRYMHLIRSGAEELGLKREWQDRIAKVPTAPFGTPVAAEQSVSGDSAVSVRS